jgi:PAS domain S-box-containing protein
VFACPDHRADAARTGALTRLVTAIARVDSVEEAYDLALRGVEEIVAPDRCAMLVFDEAGVMRFRAWRGLSEGYRQAVEGHSPWPPTATDAQPVLVPDVFADAGLRPLLATIAGEGIRALAFVPLAARRLVGKFMLYYDRPHAFAADEIALAQAVAGVVAFAVERIRAEAALRDSEEFLKRAFESSPDCITVLGVDGRVQSVNTSGLRLLEVDEVDLVLGTPWIGFWQGADREAAAALARARRGETGAFEGFRPTADGVPRWWDVRVSGLHRGDGIERLVSIARDITERRRAQALIVGQNEALEMIVRGEPLGRVLATLARVVDEQGAGKAAASIMLLEDHRLRNGASPGLPDDYLAAVDGIVIHPELGTCAAAAARREVIVTPDIAADPRWADFAHLPLALGLRAAWSMPILSGSGEVLGTFGTYLREARSPTREEIQTVGALTRTAAVAIEHVRAASALAAALGREQSANHAKDEFLAMLSHELRTPLNAMMGWTAMLRGGTLDTGSAHRALEAVDRNTRLLARLLEDLLDVSRIVSGKLTLERRRTPVLPIVEAAVESVRHTADAKAIALTVDYVAGPVHVIGDPTRLQQVVWNVLANAVKFTPHGGRVSVGLAMAVERVEIRVTDTGCGIAPAVLPVIFDPFRQADSTSRRRHGGLGLGLAIVRHLVELHDGQVRAESEGEGRGATFVITLPLAPVVADPPRVLALRAGDATGPRLDGLRLLVVDDEPDARDLFATVFAQRGAAVTAVASVGEALAAIERTRPDLLVADISMPGRDGYELIRAVRATANRRPLRAIAVTAHARREDRDRVLGAGYDAYLAKPIDLPALVALAASLAGGEAVSTA